MLSTRIRLPQIICILVAFNSVPVFATSLCEELFSEADSALKLATRSSADGFESWEKAADEAQKNSPSKSIVCNSLTQAKKKYVSSNIQFDECAYSYLLATKECRSQRNKSIAQRKMEVCEINVEYTNRNIKTLKSNIEEWCD